MDERVSRRLPWRVFANALAGVGVRMRLRCFGHWIREEMVVMMVVVVMGRGGVGYRRGGFSRW